LGEQDRMMHEDLQYRGEDEDWWKLDLALPREPARTPAPCVVVVHGGGWQSCTKRSGMELMFLEHFPTIGLAAASVEYRLSGLAPWPAQLIDVRCALRFLRARAADYGLDPERMAGIGHSAGGHLAAMAGLVRDEDWIDGDVPRQHGAGLQAVVGLSGAYNLSAMVPTGDDDLPGWFGELLPGPLAGFRERARAASPIRYIRSDAPPFMVCHGDADDTCPLGQAREFVEALHAAGTEDVTLRVFEGAGHGVAGEEGLMDLVDGFLERTLLE